MPAKESLKRFRLLVIEDNSARVDLFRTWVTPNVQIVWARSAGAALGLINRDPGYLYGGVLLDHDLDEQAMTDADLGLSGTQVAEALILNFSFYIPVLVHSTNQIQAPIVVSRLERSGFSVTHIPMYQLTPEAFNNWLSEAIEFWNMNQGDL